jgi:hypothetical protein
VNAHRKDILDGLDHSPSVKKMEYVKTGFDAAKATIDLMRKTFKALPPDQMLQVYLDAKKKHEDTTKAFWTKYGKGTIAAMQDGTHLLAVLWESAWVAGKGEDKNRDTSALKPKQAMGICARAEFLPSCTIVKVGQFLSKAPPNRNRWPDTNRAQEPRDTGAD